MVMDFFESLLHEIGQSLGVELHPDENHTCLLKMQSGLKIQLEMHPDSHNLLIGSEIAEVPVGAYRENVFKIALKANGSSYPRYGTFAYSKQSNSLILFEMIPEKHITSDLVLAFIELFSKKALVFKEAIDRGELPHLETEKSPSGGLFGLSP